MIHNPPIFKTVRAKAGRGPARRRQPIYRETELGREQLCDKCHDWWPADPEFFAEKGGVMDCRCKACNKRDSGGKTEVIVNVSVPDQAVWGILYGRLVKPALSNEAGGDPADTEVCEA